MTRNIEWALDADVVVVGAGGAGLVSAINAHDAGSSVLVLEKMPHVGGITILAGGGIKAARDHGKAVSYLTETQGGRVSDRLIDAFAQGLVELPDYLRGLAQVNGAEIGERADTHEGIYPFPGADTLYSLTVTDISGFAGYDWTYTGKNLAGQRFFKVLLDNVLARNIPVHTGAPVRSLITADGEVIGVWAEIEGRKVAVRANRAVVLASGGFEFNEKLKREYFEALPVYAMGNPGNTGDGILMAQKVGAALWHMWHFHGSYGFKFDDYDTAFRIAPGGARNPNRPISWIILDTFGKRFMNELHPATQDTAARPLGLYDADVPGYTRIPAYLVFDEEGRKLGRIANPLTSHPEHRYVWSEDNSAEVARGWIKRYDTVEELAAAQGWEPAVLKATLARWDEIVRSGSDDDHRRPAGTLFPIGTPPFYVVPVWPLLTNTQGGPEHDEHQRVVDPYGEPIPRLFAAGELGSFFAHLYLLGGNLSEIVISGRIAGTQAAGLPRWTHGQDRARVA
ncbi:FAD-dependent oxidoreductase [Ancylobacter sonchi]|uniref:FAD-dependent oxidoreductase n=1 Tax=Ancylobacter sonchi TaxID=1937790 RepID=UPI001BD3C5CC|nr:FAD-dependent oxidoreductase [Ancylobacter sonchi]MBS7535193.1 FAD-dependent oxidoreductase [Ancylobacter sonchi]